VVDTGTLVGISLVILGLFLFAAELIHPGAFLLIPGSIVIVAGLMYVFLPTLLTESIFGPAIVVTVAALATIIEIPYYRWLAPVHRPMVTIPLSMVGEEGVVLTAVVPDTLKGKVRVRGEVWSARSPTPIPEGTRVRVIGGEGVGVDVVPVVSPQSPGA
jgi:membrane protein implicated in regulation of membrane protease activity